MGAKAFGRKRQKVIIEGVGGGLVIVVGDSVMLEHTR